MYMFQEPAHVSVLVVSVRVCTFLFDGCYPAMFLLSAKGVMHICEQCLWSGTYCFVPSTETYTHPQWQCTKHPVSPEGSA